MADDVKVKVDGDPVLAKENAKLYKKPAKEDVVKQLVNGKEKVQAVKVYSTGAKNKGIRKGTLVSCGKKGKKK